MIPFIDLVGAARWVVGVLVGISVLMTVFALIPSVGLPAGIATAIHWVVQMLVNFDWLFPIDTLFQIVGLIILIQVVEYGAIGIIALYKFFHGRSR